MNILSTIITGFIIGTIARFSKMDDDKMGFSFTILVAIAGAFVGRYLGQAIGFYSAEGANGLVGSVLGSIFVLAIAKQTNNGRKFKRQHQV